MDSATLKTDIEKQMCESRIANAEMLLECSLAGDNVDPKETYFPLLDAVSLLGNSGKCYLTGKAQKYDTVEQTERYTHVGLCGRADHPPLCSMSSWIMPGKIYRTESNIDHTEFESSNKQLYNFKTYAKIPWNNPTYKTVSWKNWSPEKNPYSNKLGYSIAYESSNVSPNQSREKPWVSSSYFIVILYFFLLSNLYYLYFFLILMFFCIIETLSGKTLLLS